MFFVNSNGASSSIISVFPSLDVTIAEISAVPVIMTSPPMPTFADIFDGFPHTAHTPEISPSLYSMDFLTIQLSQNLTGGHSMRTFLTDGSHSNIVENASVTISAVDVFTPSQVMSSPSSQSTSFGSPSLSAAGVSSQDVTAASAVHSYLSSMPSMSIICEKGCVNCMLSIPQRPSLTQLYSISMTASPLTISLFAMTF